MPLMVVHQSPFDGAGSSTIGGAVGPAKAGSEVLRTATDAAVASFMLWVIVVVIWFV